MAERDIYCKYCGGVMVADLQSVGRPERGQSFFFFFEKKIESSSALRYFNTHNAFSQTTF